MKNLSESNILWNVSNLTFKISNSSLNTIFCSNIFFLIEMILLLSETLELKTSLDTSAKGIIIESSLSQSQGPVATLIVNAGVIKVGDKIRMMRQGTDYEVEEVGIFNPQPEQIEELKAGEVGYIACHIKQVADV